MMLNPLVYCSAPWPSLVINIQERTWGREHSEDLVLQYWSMGSDLNIGIEIK